MHSLAIFDGPQLHKIHLDASLRRYAYDKAAPILAIKLLAPNPECFSPDFYMSWSQILCFL